MKLRITLFVLLMLVALMAAQSSLTAKPTLAGAIAAATTATPSPTSDAGNNATEQAAPAAEASSGQVFQVTIATYLLDTAGFHGMDERINQAGVIEAGDAGVVNRASGVLAATAWPEALQAQVDPLKDTLSQYAEALANDDVETAKPLATQAHDQQHDLSHAAAAWLGEMTGSGADVSGQEQLFQVTIATYLLDTAGFHGMDERINQAGVIEAGDAGVVNRVSGVLAATAWPEDLQTLVDPLKDTLSQYAEALANDNVEAAKPLATQAHDQQHDLSHAAAAWLGEMTGSGEHGADEAGEE